MRILPFVSALGLSVAAFAGIPEARTAYAHIPGWFEPSANGRAYLSHGSIVQLAVGAQGATMSARGGSVGLVFAGGSAAVRVEPLDRQPGRSDYLIGSRRAQWRHGVAHFERVALREVYAGVDAIFYHQGRQLEYDLVVRPGADPQAIRLQFSARPRLLANGGLAIGSGKLTLEHRAPVAYQERDGQRVAVASAYRVARNGEVSLQLGDYDRNRELVIDPLMDWGGYLGGEAGDVINSVAAAPDGSYWLGGSTSSPYIEVSGTNPYNMTKDSYTDAFLAQVVPGGSRGFTLANYTYIGGSADDEIVGIAMRGYRIAFAGNTTSIDFPRKGFPYQEESAGEQDVVVGMYDPTWPDLADDKLVFSTYWGGELKDTATAMAWGPDNRITVVGRTVSTTLKGAADGYSLQYGNRGGVDGFIAQFDPFTKVAGGALIWCTFLGGNSTDIINSVGVDDRGMVYVSGTTMSWDFPTVHPDRDWINGASDGFLAIIDSNAWHLDMLTYSTFIGGSGAESNVVLSVDNQRRVWLAGATRSTDLPVTRRPYQSANAGGTDVFLARLNPWAYKTGAIEYLSYFGGSGSEVPYAIAVDNTTGAVTFVGYTTSSDFPKVDLADIPLTAVRQTEAFMARLDPAQFTAADQLLWSTRVGGANGDVATSVALDAGGGALVAGYTSSLDMPNYRASKPSGGAFNSGMLIHIQ